MTSTSILTSRIFSIIYGSIYALFVFIITVYALIEFIQVYNKYKRQQNSNTKNNSKDAIELHIITNSQPETLATNTDEMEQKYDTYELKHEHKAEEEEHEDEYNSSNISI
eukprot:546092_1